MNRAFERLAAVTLAVLLACSSADAGWWIFGKSKEAVDFGYLYVNGISFDETDKTLVLYRDALPGGAISIRGKAAARGAKAGAVEISLDEQNTWHNAKLSSDGVFEYSFVPALEKYVLFVRVTETTGKTNDVERSRKEIVISDKNISDEIRNLIDELAAAYAQKDARQFMSRVSSDFTGGDVVLESAIRKDFNAFAHLMLRFTVTSATSDPSGRVQALIRYNRSLTAMRDGKTYNDDGSTEFGFKFENGRLALLSMKNPLIFGLSEASEVASGSTIIGGNTQLLMIDGAGNVSLKPFAEGIDEIQGGGETAAGSSNVTFVIGDVFTFATGIKENDIALFQDPLGALDLGYFEGDYLTVNKDVTYQLLPPGTDLDSLTQVPTSGYGKTAAFDYANYSLIELIGAVPGDCYAFKLRDGTYAVIQIENLVISPGQLTFKYRYQPDGSNRF